ncbi:MAG: methionine--tRNA ligase [Chlamydiales bacterium]|nr:methionine--tRNA ligase [Chlamydiales bacterium]
MAKKVLITSALPYANGPLHFGHIAGAYLPADCYARFQRLMGSDVLYICGSDEHGVAITLSAQMAGRTPKEHVDLFHKINENFFKQLNFSFDHYSRTTWPGHVETTQQFFLDLLKNNFIEERVTSQLYSEEDKRFLADRYVIGTCPKCGFKEARGDECQKCGASYEATDLIEPKSKISGKALTLKPTKHWFLRFDLFKERLGEWLQTKNWKPNVLNFAKSYVDDLKPRAITRDSDWGIPVPLPGSEGKVFYVWFDAPIGYISATKEWAEKRGDPNAWKNYWLDIDTQYVQFIGKDNIPFHAVFFPAMVMGQDVPYKLVDQLPANEFFNLEGKQFSKSEGWYIDLETFFQKFTPDQIRYAIAANAPESQDSEFTWKDFQLRCNSELLGKYGNLASRVLVFAANNCEAKVPEKKDLQEIDSSFLEKIQHLVKEIAEAYETFHLRKASSLVMELAQAGNVYFDAKKPWQANKDPTRKQEMLNAIACCLECLKALAVVSFPLIPETAERLWTLLGYTKPLTSKNWKTLIAEEIPEGRALPPPVHLFAKVEDELIQKEIEKLETLTSSATPPAPAVPLKEQVSFDEVRKLDLRVGQILAVERIPKSKKLLKLSVDLGFEKRTIVAGIGEKMEDLNLLIGKKVVIVANLKPAALMGVESQGMLLAADTSLGIELPAFQNALPGTPVT